MCWIHFFISLHVTYFRFIYHYTLKKNGIEFFLLLALLIIVDLNLTERLYVSLEQSLFRKM